MHLVFLITGISAMCHAGATTKAKTPLLVGSAQWLSYLDAIRLGRKSQSPGGMYLPHLIRESSRMKGSRQQKFTLPHDVPIQTSLGEGSCGVQLPKAGWGPAVGCPQVREHVCCVLLTTSPFSTSAATLPQPNPRPHISTLFRHNPQAPLRSKGFGVAVPKPRLSWFACFAPCTAASGKLVKEALRNGVRGTTGHENPCVRSDAEGAHPTCDVRLWAK